MSRVEEPAVAGIKVRASTKRKLDELKVHPRETYDQVITRLIEFYEKHRERQ